MLPRFLPLLTLVLLQACEKAEEKPASKPPAASPPADRPAAPPAGTSGPQLPTTGQTAAPAPPPPRVPRAPAPTQEEVDAYCKEAEAFVKEAASQLNGSPPPSEETMTELRAKLMPLMQTRGRMLRGMTVDERKSLTARLKALAEIQQQLLLPSLPGVPAAPASAPQAQPPAEPGPSR